MYNKKLLEWKDKKIAESLQEKENKENSKVTRG